MSFVLVFSEEANFTFKDIQTQILERFSVKEAKIFETKVLKSLNTINQFPYSFELVLGETNLYKGFIHKHCSVFYQIEESQIQILFFWDNRQEPLPSK